MHIRSIVKLKIEEIGITQTWLSNKTGINNIKINRLIHGTGNIYMQDLLIIMGIFKWDINTSDGKLLFSGSDQKLQNYLILPSDKESKKYDIYEYLHNKIFSLIVLQLEKLNTKRPQRWLADNSQTSAIKINKFLRGMHKIYAHDFIRIAGALDWQITENGLIIANNEDILDNI